ncbi:zinc finger SWIM domain-containing protein 3 [Spea bombifrons]|uniref:zinc finger SWIM domain-containing protein 3 n=1 Tax=Spea bombifrons TaxID=233779 RepID=UPI00234A8FA5|nr:zinc finger SWIM domain-containing protein 3 [Spea bombifrons]XP_053309173.1 zinc finger SWIM domain-containing protein 3 [Spea bombifrons]
MQLGSCFINYEDFEECFNEYREETKTSYSMKNTVSVRCHNRSHHADIRQDVIFTHVKFCCSQLNGHRRKKKTQENTCPAYFILQYDEKLDRLVVKEENNVHIHTVAEKEENNVHIHTVAEKEENNVQIHTVAVKEENNVHTHTVAVKEENNVHIHTGDKKQHPSLSILPTEKLHNGSMLSESSLKKTCAVPATDKLVVEDQSWCVKSTVPSQEMTTSKTSVSGPAPCEEATTSKTFLEEISGEAVTQLANLMQNFISKDIGAKATVDIRNHHELELLSFQTSKMSDMFVKFPECLILHRVHRKRGYVLYTFLVESKERVGKIVHFSFVKQDNTNNISRMLSIFQYFNPDWTKVKIIFTDVNFAHDSVIKEAFPSAQMLLSMYHTVSFIQKKTKAKCLSKLWLKKLIDDAIFSTSPANLSCLSEKLRHIMDKELYDYLCKNWFSCELLWYMHVKKGLHSCRTYMDSLQSATSQISNLFAKQSSMISVIQQFVEYADCFNSKGLESQSNGSLRSPKPNTKPTKRVNHVKPQLKPCKQPMAIPSLVVFHNPLIIKDSISEANQKHIATDSIAQPDKKNMPNQTVIPVSYCTYSPQITVCCTNNPDPEVVSMKDQSKADAMLESLQEHCSDLGFLLCLKEWETVQRSAHLINTQESFISVQLLEEPQLVSADGQSCTCYFNKRCKLPCRHILSILYAEKRPVEPDMVSLSWQRKSEKSNSEAWHGATEPDITETEHAVNHRDFKIKSLTKELSNLLLHCEGSEHSVRFSTLQMIVDLWSKESSPGRGKCDDSSGEQVLPYQWVKKEQLEGDENYGCLELYSSDAYPVMS